MNTTTDTNTIPGSGTIAGFSTDTEASSHSRNRRPAAKRLIVALAGASLRGGGGAFSANAQTDNAPVRCEASDLGSTDALDRSATACEQRYTRLHAQRGRYRRFARALGRSLLRRGNGLNCDGRRVGLTV